VHDEFRKLKAQAALCGSLEGGQDGKTTCRKSSISKRGRQDVFVECRMSYLSAVMAQGTRYLQSSRAVPGLVWGRIIHSDDSRPRIDLHALVHLVWSCSCHI
jgi:hypothetical protein